MLTSQSVVVIVLLAKDLYLSKYPACSISLPQVPSLVALFLVPAFPPVPAVYVDGLQLWV